jgi:FMN phosphatase YigB (HAD superfamily)
MSNSLVDPERIRVIGWDLDQTLYPKSRDIDTAIRSGLYVAVAEKQGIGLEEAKDLFDQLYLHHGKGEAVFAVLGFKDAGETYQQILENADLTDFLHQDPQTIDTLTRIKQVYKQDLITGSPSQTAQKRLAKLGIDMDVFGVKIYGDSVSAGIQLHKVGGAAFRFWASQYPEFEPHQFLYVGDRPESDLFPAIELGFQSVIIYPKPNIDTEVVTIGHPSEIMRLLA